MVISNWRQLLGGRLKYVLSVESTCTRASLHSDQNIISRWVSLNATKMNYQTIFAFKFFGIGTNPQVRGMQRFSTVRETKLAALSRFSQVQKPSFSSINSTHQSLLYYPLDVLSVRCNLLTPFMRQMSSKGGAETKRKAMAKMPKTYIKYNKFRDKWMKRAAASRSFKTFKKVYSDKKAAENGAELTKMGIVERMKFFISHYGKVFIPLHYVFGTGVYFSTCYLAVYVGLDITPLLEQLPQNAKDFLHLDKVNEYKKTGIFIQALALYKLLTPLRYLCSVTLTTYIVKYLRERGSFITPPSVKEAVSKSIWRQRHNLKTKRKTWQSRLMQKRK